MIVNLPTSKIMVEFKHLKYPKPVYDKATCKKFLNGVTFCMIYTVTNEKGNVLIPPQLRVSGTSRCKFPDTFCKRYGRKQALTSALTKTWGPNHSQFFSKEDRQLVWDAYWNMTEPQPRAIHERPDADIFGNLITGP